MTCPDPARLAAAASAEDAAALLHAQACATCGPIVAELAATAAALDQLAAPTLDPAHRARLADAVLVATDAGALLRRPRRWPGLAIAAAAVVALALGIAASGDPVPAPSPVVAAPAPAPGPGPGPVPGPDPAPVPVPAPAPVATPAPVITALGAADHTLSPSADTLVLRDGAVAVDTRGARPLTVTLGKTRIAVGDAQVEVRAKQGALVAVRVFAGSVEVTGPTGRTTAVVAGEVWHAPAPPAPSAPPAVAAVTEVEWFRRGWVELRAEHFDTAIAAFDRATDPAVAEDAAFWAAIACERAGRTDEARARLARFLATYAGSARADVARAHLAALPDPAP